VGGSALGFDYATFAARAPEAAAAMGALSAAVDASGLPKELSELVKLRASQVNRCEFCLGFHLSAARKAGVSQEKIDSLSSWRDAGVFTDRERAALVWTEKLTAEVAEGVDDADRADLLRHFTETEAVFLTVTVGTINQWNRIATGLRFPSPGA
tara:strand:- start:170 stop:631 length:462 start_codon:yes stop_codon:yes gene_type:complete